MSLTIFQGGQHAPEKHRDPHQAGQVNTTERGQHAPEKIRRHRHFQTQSTGKQKKTKKGVNMLRNFTGFWPFFN